MQIEDADAFRAWLAAQLPGEFVAPPGALLPAPDRQVGVKPYDPGGERPNWQGTYHVQLRMRSQLPGANVNPYREAHILKDKVMAVVAPPGDTVPVISLTGGHRATLKVVSGPLPLGADDKSRWEFTINVALETSRV